MTLSRFSGQYRAVSFNYGGNGVQSPPALVVISAPGLSGAQTLTVQNGWTTASDGTIFTPFNTNASVSVVNATGVDTQTPSAVSTYVQSALYGPTATVTATWTNAHYAGDRISSGTVGLQEAINFADSKGGGIVIVDADWTTQGGTTAILNAATVPASGDVQIIDNRGGQAAALQTVTLTPTLAQVQAMFTTPIVVVPAPGAGNLVDVQEMVIEAKFGSAAFTGGGAIQLSYGAGVTTPATATIAATFLTTFTASQLAKVAGVIAASTASTAAVNAAVNLTNATAVFAAGTAATFVIKVSYRILTGF